MNVNNENGLPPTVSEEEASFEEETNGFPVSEEQPDNYNAQDVRVADASPPTISGDVSIPIEGDVETTENVHDNPMETPDKLDDQSDIRQQDKDGDTNKKSPFRTLPVLKFLNLLKKKKKMR